MDATMEEVIATLDGALQRLHNEKPITVQVLYAAMVILAERARVQHETDYQAQLAKVREQS